MGRWRIWGDVAEEGTEGEGEAVDEESEGAVWIVTSESDAPDSSESSDEDADSSVIEDKVMDAGLASGVVGI